MIQPNAVFALLTLLAPTGDRVFTVGAVMMLLVSFWGPLAVIEQLPSRDADGWLLRLAPDGCPDR